jgi:hypothetical protein
MIPPIMKGHGLMPWLLLGASAGATTMLEGILRASRAIAWDVIFILEFLNGDFSALIVDSEILYVEQGET